MPRPIKTRIINYIPVNKGFTPLTESSLDISLDYVELESLRLSDLMNMEQSDCADSLNISRGTYQRILNLARYKVTDALINGKNIIIEGGNYEINDIIANPHGRRYRGGRG